jgi:glycine cleavage system H lipoate-binding protein
MPGHEFLSAYPAKLMEYSLGFGYLLLFIPFWRYLRGGSTAQVPVRAGDARRAAGAEATSWFTAPDGVLLHPGHTWARLAAGGLVEVGLDEFAARMLGPVERIALPEPGSPVAQGSPALLACDGDKVVPLVSPVDGTVAEVNSGSGAWQQEPYGAGWLFKVAPSRLESNARQLLSGAAARRWLEHAGESLAALAAPRLGAVLQDGGAPVPGIARELSPEGWDALCRQYFRS